MKFVDDDDDDDDDDDENGYISRSNCSMAYIEHVGGGLRSLFSSS